ncbi:L-lactate permease [Ktedonosporobacter rubrisoli]|uniref:L-lactate permease n=1 Tax=Ktedonosporobacter rubrisoli TaxID=2509675 RepID=A0A4P6K0B8_KTERU|nr:L-lactate permease [Ktedonosporobacter rubrisoli]QBD81474.1 L-lactate permease [Ktedonosporobacter rubrisoli]
MFQQILSPVADNLFLSFLVGIIPIIVVLILLGIVRRAAWQAALAGLVAGFIIAIAVWRMPIGLAADATLNGIAFALVPVMWIVWAAMWLYNVTVRSGKFELFRRWMVYNVPADKRILLLIVGFSFGALMEGIAGFGTPVAICSALLIALGFPVLEALTLTLIFNTTPVAFGALGVPIVTLAGVTGLPASTLGAMVGRQLPIFALFLPFYAILVFTGWRGLRTVWPVALVAGLSFAVTQFVISNFVGPELPDVLASLVSLICVILFVQIWKPQDIEQYRASVAAVPAAVTDGSAIGEAHIPASSSVDAAGSEGKPTLQESIFAWLPWLLVSVIVIAWTFLKVPTLGQQLIKWPGLHNVVFLTLYRKPYAAVYTFQILGTGTAILLAVIFTTIVVVLAGAKPIIFVQALADTWRQLRFAILTVVLIVGLAYLYNYSGMAYTVGLAISKVGAIFPFFSVFLGWIACFLSGSDTSSNALFGNLQVVAARQLNLSPVLMAAANSSGAVMSKMVSPQNITTGVSTTELVGKEGLIVQRTFIHSIILATILGVIVLIQQYLIPGIIPH